MIPALRKLVRSRSANCNLIRSITCRSKPRPQYKLRVAYPQDYSRLMRFMADTYFRSEPSIVNIGGNLSGQPNPTLVHLMDKSIREGMSLIAEDLVNGDCIVGAAVNVDSRPFDNEKNAKLAETCCERREARDLIEFSIFCSRQADLWNVYCIDSVFECAYLAVHPEHQGRGIARKLVEESWILARDMAYRLFRIDCSSRYTANIAESFGWKCIYSIPYRRYFNDGRFIFTCVEEPHTEFRVFVDRLNHYKNYSPPTKRRSESSKPQL
ncbi:uncharacterized protein LOC103316019 [Nasonia vitripennis]|uniref:aralkylamine N-acetyltransferase n=1 Tax=Nasonia vitripennis TaxID=7425 RepID=A0A7M7H4F9_NASVI|nr:uncharacterized protein LOC103316019 [Nasonia vitripennis]